MSETSLYRIALALERIADRMDKDAGEFSKMVDNGRTIAVESAQDLIADERRKRLAKGQKVKRRK